MKNYRLTLWTLGRCQTEMTDLIKTEVALFRQDKGRVTSAQRRRQRRVFFSQVAWREFWIRQFFQTTEAT